VVEERRVSTLVAIPRRGFFEDAGAVVEGSGPPPLAKPEEAGPEMLPLPPGKDEALALRPELFLSPTPWLLLLLLLFPQMLSSLRCCCSCSCCCCRNRKDWIFAAEGGRSWRTMPGGGGRELSGQCWTVQVHGGRPLACHIGES
jgi:hypothetical protein